MGALKEFVIAKARPLPVIILADTSGSMSVDGKIQTLSKALHDMIGTFAGQSRLHAEIQVAIITFGNRKAELALPLTLAKDIGDFSQLPANGDTPMGQAFDTVRELLEDRERIPSRAYRPTLVLLSDGQPTDAWEAPLKALMSAERASKASRFAMAIGADADERPLKAFANDLEAPVFRGHEARDIIRFIRAVTMSVTVRSTSQTPNQPAKLVIPPADDLDLDL